MDISNDNARPNTVSLAAHNIIKFLKEDTSGSMLYDQMGIPARGAATCSGQSDNDYPNFSNLPLALSKLGQIKSSAKVPLPAEILERFRYMQCNSNIGLFTEINRGWITIDSDIYVWSYEDGSDVAYFDGLNETILCVGLIRPRAGVFHNFITHLLVLTTAVDIVVLGVTFTSNNSIEEIQLVPEPVFTLSSDGAAVATIVGTDTGRLFLGTKDGCLLEIVYQAESTWFGKRCKKINHSTSTLSLLVPSFLNAALTEDDAITQISIDNSRHILYVLSEKGSICVYDLGENGKSLNKIIKLSQNSIIQHAVTVVRGLEGQSFCPIVGISAVESKESLFVNLVAVSHTGVRFYFSVNNFLNLQTLNQRPTTLVLCHVRLPPGFSALSTPRPRGVVMSQYRQSNLVLVTAVNESDTLWCISSDMFPFSTKLMEGFTTIPLDGPVWAMAEIKQQSDVVPKQLTYQVLPPTVVRQHYEPPRKFVVLTAQGAHIFSKLRPVDMLRQLLLDCRGPDSEAIKMFFMILKEEQACATSLILGCLENVQNIEVAEWATRAFFLYGGEPKGAAQPSGVANLNQFRGNSVSSSFIPNVMSTPLPPHLQQQQQQINYSSSTLDQSNFTNNFDVNSFVYSARHNGLYLYLARILGPIWDVPCVERLTVNTSTYFLCSKLPSETCSWMLSHVLTLRTFILKNTRLMVNSVSDSTLQQSVNMSQQSLNSTRTNQTIPDSQIQERQSLEAFKYLLFCCCQVLGLWKILCEHQLHLIIDVLSVSEKQILEGLTFRDLILNGQDICISLINILIDSYLSDNAAIDSISLKLRDTCPDLYKNEDAICSKVYEMLKSAQILQNYEEKEEVIVAAMQLARSVAPHINLHEICQQLVSLNAYHAATDICVTCAKKVDPDCVAEYFYKNGTEVRNTDNYNYYSQRMKIYKEVIFILDKLYNDNISADAIQARLDLPGSITNDETVHDLVLRVIYDILTFDDELLHVAVYEWMIVKQFNSDIIKIKQPTLEKYLVRASQQSQENTNTLNLLWKYYESCNNHASAAKILHNLAIKKENGLTLRDRLSNLARAVMCMRSENVGYAPSLGVFLRDLEDKLEMAKVQEQVLDSIVNLQGRVPDVEEAVMALNNGLYDLTQLYEEFADKFHLWQCKLAIIDCAGYKDDIALVETIWQHIIDGEIQLSSGSGNDKVLQVLSTVLNLIRRYKVSSICVPLPYIVSKLEIMSIRMRASADLVTLTLASEILFEILIPIYNDLVVSSFSDRFWTLEENEYHLAEAFVALVNKFLENEVQIDNHTRNKIKAPCEDTVAKLLSTFYSKSNADQLINLLRNVQAKLAK